MTVTKTETTTERTNRITKQIIDYVKEYGQFAKRVNTQGIRGRKSRNKGAADIRILFKSVSLDVEIKKDEKDKLNPDQILYKSEIEQAGGLYWTVTSFEDFENKLISEFILK